MNNKSYVYLKAIADDTRLRILSLLNKQPKMCVCQLMEIMGISQTTLSKALSVLKKAELVIDERDGQWVRYSLADPNGGFPVKKILACMDSDPIIGKDLSKLKKIKTIPLEKICCNKPWRK